MTKRITYKRLLAPWISDSLKNCIDHKHKLYRSSKSNPQLFIHYKQYNNRLKSIIQTAKTEFYKRKFEFNSNDMKSTWKSINSLIKPKMNKNNYCLKIDGTVTTDENIISESFNAHFSSVAPKLSSQIPTNDINPLNYVTRNPHSFLFFSCTAAEVTTTINSLKSKKGSTHEIPTSIYKKVVDIISPVISDLINSSVNSGTFPKLLKIARVVPIHKGGTKSDVTNYRPISILPTLSKIFEKIIHKKVTVFFNKFNLFYPDQYGFQSKKSTTDAIIRFTDKCYDILNDKKSLISIYLDFSKAFDTIEHNLLCKKLECYGIRGSVNNWFRSYLTSRQQYVQINSIKSNNSQISCGVPQGSVLGPLLFLIYINDMHKCTQLKLIHFADDTTAFMSHNDINTLALTINTELENIDKWICANKLSLNASKSSFSLFTNKKTPSYPDILIRNSQIQRSPCQKFLGVQLDERLNFCNHINSVRLKLSRVVGILWKLSYFVPSSVLNTIYHSLIYPHLTYAIEVWGNSSKVAINRLSSKVRRAQKIVTSGAMNNELSSKLFSVKQIHQLFCLTRFFKYYRLRSNPYFYDKFCQQHTNHAFNTRFSYNNLLVIPKINVSRIYGSFFYSSIKYWNALSPTVRNSESLSSRKKNTNK